MSPACIKRIKASGAILAILISIAATSLYYAGISNEVIHFSKESGFYEESFWLEISGKGQNYTYYYTLDGSTPDIHSQKYTQPILMEDVSKKANVYSARKDVSPDYEEKKEEEEERERIIIGGSWIKYRLPVLPVDKCNIIRVAAYNWKNERVAEKTGEYFIGFQDKSGYDGIKIVSLVTAPENLFDDETGIYVMGKTGGNYEKRGRNWERPATVCMYDERKEKIFSSNCGIRIHGWGSRSRPQKSFNAYARPEYDGKNRFSYDLFENGIEAGPHKFVLFSGSQDDRLKVRDWIAQEAALEAELNVATLKLQPCALFLDGEYWGAYYLMESYDAAFIRDHYKVAEDNSIVIKGYDDKGKWVIAAGTEEDLKLYNEMAAYICNHDMRDSSAYQRACQMIDIDSFVDYYALEIYIGNDDWPHNNLCLWRARKKNLTNSWADGRWRYMLADTNASSAFRNPTVNDIERVMQEDTIFTSLIQNQDVQEKFCNRIRQLEKETFSRENTEELFVRWYDEMGVAQEKNCERYYDTSKMESTEQRLTALRQFLEARPEYIEQHMTECFEKETP